MPRLRSGHFVKFKLKPEFDSELTRHIHATADGYLFGIFFEDHEVRSPEVKRDGMVIAPATAQEVPAHIVPLKPSGEDVMVPNFEKNIFEKLIFTLDKVDMASIHYNDHEDHIPPGRVVADWYRQELRAGSEKRQAEETAKAASTKSEV